MIQYDFNPIPGKKILIALLILMIAFILYTLIDHNMESTYESPSIEITKVEEKDIPSTSEC